ncbi:fumarylacetoacetate hydrolase family protein [Bordetella bronchialis]|uniref:5-carboxymethyl-2-hydroxymuconate isomerase n=1 Tax=Bordetella bronchialis TaxID=463025 RepID=A0A193FS08_9BORD|nr:fumarylacetoacetate hydrolase family protein [Bordetella bronchialis]ANN65507.1 5-carboxymethyl-2-hydroxymuconate isomerase [Bordetella bronchialis]ANN70537.1 5-carboxymethyl-2-hydroxymuconate isomerase [Bordetella bronchialis]
MKLLSYIHEGRPGWGMLDRDGQVVDGQAWTGGRHASLKSLLAEGNDAWQGLRAPDPAHPRIALERLRLLPVIPDPGKILCVGLNYEEHRRETNRAPTGEPTLFLRVASSQIGHGDAIVVPRASDQVDYEGEIAIVIGRPGRHIAQDRAWSHIAGYAPYNDVSVRDWQQHTTQWTPGKNFDGTGAFGPWMTTRDEIADGAELGLETRLNGAVVQRATTAQLIFDIPRLVHYASRFTTLQPGDVIVTGTPGGVGFKRNPPVFLKAGDVVEVEVSGVGCLSNPVRGE